MPDRLVTALQAAQQRGLALLCCQELCCTAVSALMPLIRVPVRQAPALFPALLAAQQRGLGLTQPAAVCAQPGAIQSGVCT